MKTRTQPSLESLVARFRKVGGPANLRAHEIDRLLANRSGTDLTEVEVQTLRVTLMLAGRGA